MKHIGRVALKKRRSKKEKNDKSGLCLRAKAVFAFGKAESFILRYFSPLRTY